MRSLQLLMYCVAILAVTGYNGSRELDSSSATLINTRLKRESENDSQVTRPKLPTNRKPPKLLIPLKQANPTGTHPPLPRRKLVPIMITKPKVLNNKTIKENDKLPAEIKNPEEKTAEANNIVGNVTTKLFDPLPTDKYDDKITESREVKEFIDLEKNMEVPTGDSELKNNKENSKANESTITTSDQLKPDVETINDSIDTIEDQNNETIRNETIIAVNANSNIDEKQGAKSLITNPPFKHKQSLPEIENPVTNILSKYKIVPGIAIDKSEIAEIINTPELSSKNNTSAIPPEKIIPLTIISKTTKLIPIVVNTTEKHDKNYEDLNKIKDKSSNNEPEEIVIENNNYEELFENITPSTTPHIISSDLRTNFWDDSSQALSFANSRKSNDISADRPYSYAVTKYPDSYVVHTFDDDRNQMDNTRNINNNFVERTPKTIDKVKTAVTIDKIETPNENVWYENNYMNNHFQGPLGQSNQDFQENNNFIGRATSNIDKVNTNDKNNANIWDQNNSIDIQLQKQFGLPNDDLNQYAQFVGQPNSINQLQYPNRIWRSWKNHHIFIRPKTTVGYAELYKGLASYLANANVQKVPVYYSSQIMNPRMIRNQNTSPANPFHRYGYYDKNNVI